MASEGEDTLKGGRRDLSEGTHEPRECMACRGTGRVLSQLGGTESAVTCPWCEGGGLRLAEGDAQAHWGAGEESGAGAAPDARAPDGGSQGSAPETPAADAGDGGPAAA